MDNALNMLDAELSEWAKSKQRAQLFLRDDDAVDITPALTQLCATTKIYDIPLLLAVIPKLAGGNLEKLFRTNLHITAAVHGFSHTNHSREGEKKCEFGDHRSQNMMEAEMREGREILGGMFGDRLSDIFVPPWNRMGEKAIEASSRAGFHALSGFSWKPHPGQQIWHNTHVDIIDWRDAKKGKSLARVVVEIADNLLISRGNGFQPIGLLTHHLVHDLHIWEMLDGLFKLLGERGIKWLEITPS